MNSHELKRRFPEASPSFIKANSSDETAIVEPVVGNAALATPQVENSDSAIFLVRVTSIRKRLLDEDNLCAKYVIDCCRYAGILPDDSPDKTHIEVTQRKAAKGETEETIIEVSITEFKEILDKIL